VRGKARNLLIINAPIRGSWKARGEWLILNIFLLNIFLLAKNIGLGLTCPVTSQPSQSTLA
jgi:hypothetical protein